MVPRMICRIAGTLESLVTNRATLALPGGVWREVLLPVYLAELLADKAGTTVTLTTIEYLESHNQGASFTPRLIGFFSAQEREFFELLTTVKGIGTRKALRAMAVAPAVIARAIATRDTAALTKLPEIGKRMAETVIAELHGKVDPFLSASEIGSLEMKSGGRGKAPLVDEAVAALVSLGESSDQASRRVAAAMERARAQSREPATSGELLALVYGSG